MPVLTRMIRYTCFPNARQYKGFYDLHMASGADTLHDCCSSTTGLALKFADACTTRVCLEWRWKVHAVVDGGAWCLVHGVWHGS